MKIRQPKSLRVFVTLGEAFAVVFAGVAAAGSVWQGYVIHRSMNFPLLANFQAVEIKQCADWIYAARYFFDMVQWTTISIYRPSKSDAEVKIEMKEIQEEERKEQFNASRKLSSETALLRIYSSDATDSELTRIEKLQSALLQNEGTFEQISTEFTNAVDRIVQRCRRIMTGETMGAI